MFRVPEHVQFGHFKFCGNVGFANALSNSIYKYRSFSWPWFAQALLSKFPGFHSVHWVVGITQQHGLYLEMTTT
jgi:hypothetical protein